MDKFKLAIIVDVFSGGGVSKVLRDMLKELNSQNWEITVFVRDFHRLWTDSVPHNVKCKPWNGKKTIKETIKAEGVISTLKLLKNLCIIKLCRWNYGKKKFYLARCNKNLEGEFDCAIGYHMIVNDVSIMTLEKINAKRRILWVHGQKTIRKKDTNYHSKIYSKADSIVCVSKDTEVRWKQMIPKCASKITTVHNCYDFDLICQEANKECDICKNIDEHCIVTVGGMFEAKGFDRVASVGKKLLESGCKFKWYLIGSGPLQKTVEEQIAEANLEDYIHILGFKENPYTYIKNCDIYVQPSYSEGFCTSTMEAKILKRPVVTTDVPGMKEQFVNEYDGLIVESSIDGIYNGIKRLIEDKQLYDSITQHLEEQTLSNDEEIKKVLKVIKG